MSKKETRLLNIGCNYPGTLDKLNGCISDAMRQTIFYTPYMKVDAQSITILRDDSLGDTLPTTLNVLKNLKSLAETSSDDTITLITYSGHGIQIPNPNVKPTLPGDKNNNNNPEEKDKTDEGIITSNGQGDMGLISDDELNKIIKTMKGLCICFFDCCNSGSMLDLPNTWTIDKSGELNYEKENSQEIENKNIICLSAARDPEVTLDMYSSYYQAYMGLVTNLIMDYLLLNGAKDAINMVSLAKYVQKQIDQFPETHDYLLPNRIVLSSSGMNINSFNIPRGKESVQEKIKAIKNDSLNKETSTPLDSHLMNLNKATQSLGDAVSSINEYYDFNPEQAEQVPEKAEEQVPEQAEHSGGLGCPPGEQVEEQVEEQVQWNDLDAHVDRSAKTKETFSTSIIRNYEKKRDKNWFDRKRRLNRKKIF